MFIGSRRTGCIYGIILSIALTIAINVLIRGCG